MAVQRAGVGECTPAVSDLLARWRDLFRSADYRALSELYHPEAFLSGSAIAAYVGREQIRGYFESLPPSEDADVAFSDVTSRMVRSDVLVLLALATFVSRDLRLPMRLTQVWVDAWEGWVIASHHASPLADLRSSLEVNG